MNAQSSSFKKNQVLLQNNLLSFLYQATKISKYQIICTGDDTGINNSYCIEIFTAPNTGSKLHKTEH